MNRKENPDNLDSSLDTEINNRYSDEVNRDSLSRTATDTSKRCHGDSDQNNDDVKSSEAEDLTNARQLESVYEYTNKIKSFLGLDDSESALLVDTPADQAEDSNVESRDANTQPQNDTTSDFSDSPQSEPEQNSPDLTPRENGIPETEYLDIASSNITQNEAGAKNEKPDTLAIDDDHTPYPNGLETLPFPAGQASDISLTEGQADLDDDNAVNSQDCSLEDDTGLKSKFFNVTGNIHNKAEVPECHPINTNEAKGETIHNPDTSEGENIITNGSVYAKNKASVEETFENENNIAAEEETNADVPEVLRKMSSEVVKQILDEAEKKVNRVIENLVEHDVEPDNESCDSTKISGVNSTIENYDGEDKFNNENKLNLQCDTILEDSTNFPVLETLNDLNDYQSVLGSCTVNEKFNLKVKLENQNEILNISKNLPSCSDVDEDTICGIGSFRPKWIQSWATARVYLILYSIIGVLQGSYYSYLIGTLSTLEKRFAFKSKISGGIMTVDEITPLFLGVLIGYFGGKTHRPRMVALGMLLSATCCFASAMPYFIYGPAQHLTLLDVQNKTGPEICETGVRKESCDLDDRPPTLAAILFLVLGSFLKGFGNLAYYAIGLAYMDDNAKKKTTPMYFGVAFTLRLFGPLLGFLMSSAFLKYYENPFDDPGFGPDDPRWIGGWWMGFVLQGALLIIFTIPISLFPRRLPGHKPQVTELYAKEDSLLSKFGGLFTALKRLAKNPLFIFLVLNTTMSVFGGFGHYVNLPRYMENQFRLSASDASLYSGPPGLVSVMVSTMVGGFLIWKFRPNARVMTGGMVIIEIIAAIGFLILMIPRCENIQMSNAGITNEGLILHNACNTNCNCSTTAFNPVCGPDGITTYFSPCYAGCSESLNNTSHAKGVKAYANCSCVIDSSGMQNDVVTEGYCVVENCWSQALAYVVILPILMAVTSVFRVAHTMVMLRSVDPEDKSVALGTFETFLSLLAFIPYPVTFGALVDSVCLVWEKSCGQTGNCWFYDMSNFNSLLHGSSALFTALSALFLIAIYFLRSRVRSLYEDDDDTDSEEKEVSVLRLDTVTSKVADL